MSVSSRTKRWNFAIVSTHKTDAICYSWSTELRICIVRTFSCHWNDHKIENHEYFSWKKNYNDWVPIKSKNESIGWKRSIGRKQQRAMNKFDWNTERSNHSLWLIWDKRIIYRFVEEKSHAHDCRRHNFNMIASYSICNPLPIYVYNTIIGRFIGRKIYWSTFLYEYHIKITLEIVASNGT